LSSGSFRDILDNSAEGEREFIESRRRKSLEDVLIELRASSSSEELVKLFVISNKKKIVINSIHLLIMEFFSGSHDSFFPLKFKQIIFSLSPNCYCFMKLKSKKRFGVC